MTTTEKGEKGDKGERGERAGLSLPWILTSLGGGVIAVTGFLARNELSRVTTAVDASTRAAVELRTELRDGLSAVRIELVSLQARQTRGDEIATETRQALRELEVRLRVLEDHRPR